MVTVEIPLRPLPEVDIVNGDGEVVSSSVRRSTRSRTLRKPQTTQELDSSDESAFSEPEYVARTPKRKGRSIGSTGATTPKAPSSTPRRGRKPKNPGNVAESRRRPKATHRYREQSSTGSVDSTLYDAVLVHGSALTTTVSDWIDSYQTDNLEALVQLINFLIKACGCPGAITREAIENNDEIVELLHDLQNDFDPNANTEYPLVSKNKQFKKFRKNLIEFFDRLVQQGKHSILYDGMFMETLESWVIAMSSSLFRPFRHTAAIIALNLVTSLCNVCQNIQDELNVANRQLATEQKKRRTKNDRESQLATKTDELHNKKITLESYLTDFFDGVFVHRYRDVDPILRTECVKELGNWISKYPDHFMDGTYLRYIGWVLSDKSASTRLEAVKAMTKLYGFENLIGGLRNFTERFKPRILEMSLKEADASVRTATIALITHISKHGMLEDEDRDALFPLIFQSESKVRRAIAPFINQSLYDDIINDAIAESQSSFSSESEVRESQQNWVALKTIANFLAKFKDVISSEGESVDPAEEDGNPDRVIVDGKALEHQSRVYAAVEALWDEMEILKNWQCMAEYLSQDHSSSNATSKSSLDPIFRLSEEEETILLEVFVESVKLSITGKTKLGRFGREIKKIEIDNDARDAISRHLVSALPTLFAKFSPDANRAAQVVMLPQLMNLDIYNELRMNKAYEALIDELSKIFLKHTDSTVLFRTSETFKHLSSFEGYSSEQVLKLREMEESVISLVREECNRSDISTTELSDDEQHILSASLRRLEQLIRFMDLSELLQEADGESPIYELLGKVIDRSSILSEAEDPIINTCLEILYRFILWKCFSVSKEKNASEQVIDDLIKKRDWVVSRCTKLILGDRNANRSVRRMAFLTLANLLWLFTGDLTHSSNGEHFSKLAFRCPDHIQEQLTRFVEIEIENWEDKISHEESNEDANEESENEDEDVDHNSKRSKFGDSDPVGKHCFMEVIGNFVRMLMLNIFDIKHASIILPHYNRFGPVYDEVIKSLIEDTMRALLVRTSMTSTVLGLYLESLQKSFEIQLRTNSAKFPRTMSLARLFSNTTKIGGFYIRDMLEFHKNSVVYIFSKMAGYQRIGNQSNRNAMLQFFKVMKYFSDGLRAKDVSMLLKHLEDTMEENFLAVREGAKEWEPYFAYVKQLDKKSIVNQFEAVVVEKAHISAPTAEDEDESNQENPGDVMSVDQEADTASPADESPTLELSDKELTPSDEIEDDNEASGENSGVTESRGVKRTLDDDEEEDESDDAKRLRLE
ncbi:cohesin complex subunit [Basidiobolus ranarum]|uniref:Cohesin complex subunit n=1 Tax=Basidiobolus ranarum TaxID=34480 RepID=A0ABR2VTU4_9FUNG